MEKSVIPLSVPNLQGNEIKYVTQAIESEWVSTAGPYIERFENRMSQYLLCAGAVACQSGTAGLHLALLSCDVTSGDEVIVPALTFVATVNPVRYVGAEPVFMDCDDTLTMDIEKLEYFCSQKCSFINGVLQNKRSGKSIKAIIPVHIFGNISNMEAICEIAKRYHLTVIEDATEALGSYSNKASQNQYAGTFGHMGVFSFNGNKIITTGGGGMVVSNDEKLLQKCRHLSIQAKTDFLYYSHDQVGYNYRLTNLQAALGLAQLEQLENFIETKMKNYELYKTSGVSLLPFRTNTRPNYWFYSYLSDRKEELLTYFIQNNIQVRPVWRLIHTLPMYKSCMCFEVEKANYYYDSIVNLPCSSNLQEKDVLQVVKCLNEFQKRGKNTNEH